ncbi:FecR family protein [Pedobacter sp.]|jgi:transmembrane sensor|uniref:FecR family protein n=1 Tax=Pedobacter sp. TaxID=1411316 RepID=UPI002C2323C9|nr:FecR domain-containing protein [Pedobacter sp.]HWW42914.1 FecR domain-containing protein [Pedobacter sp.]
MDQEIWKLILSHVSGENNEENEIRLKEWLAKDPVHQQQFEQACDLWNDTAEITEQAGWKDSFAQIKSEVIKPDSVKATEEKRLKVVFKRWIAVAAVLGGTILLGIFFQNRRPAVHAEAAEWITETSAAGQILKVLLPDSTEVWLNSGSRIRFPKNLETSAIRNVQLTGEGFFKVKRDVKHPFIVKSLNLQTRVLGTSFNIKAWVKNQPEVTVMTGKVAVSRDSAGTQSAAIHLLPNQKAVYSRISGKLHKEDVEEAADANAWISGKLMFNQTPVQEVFEAIERRYQVRIQSEHDFKGCKLTASFKNIALAEVLQTLKITLDIHYAINKQTIYIKGGKCN